MSDQRKNRKQEGEYTVKQHRTVFTHSHLFEAAQIALGQGHESGSPYHYIHALMSAAFAMEAYLNFAGETVIPFWATLERVNVRAKLAIVCDRAAVVPDFGARPFLLQNLLCQTVRKGRPSAAYRGLRQ